MAQSYTTDDGITLFEPGAVVSTRVIAGQGGIAAAGVVTLIGEANEGPHWSEEEDLDANFFGPDQIADVTRKYGSGRLVDAFRAIVAAANDPAIVGSVSVVKLVKTNNSDEAEALLKRSGLDDYALIKARRAGAPGNLTKYKVEAAQPEITPSTGAVVYTPSASVVEFSLRVNGKTPKAISVSAHTSGPDLVAAVEDVSQGILASGGEREDPLAGLDGVAITAAAPAPDQLTVTLASGSVFAPAPEVGDTVVIPASGQYGAIADSEIAGAALANTGSYVVTSVVNTVSSATLTLRAINILGAVTVADSGSIAATEDDIIVFKSVEISNQTGVDRDVAAGLTADWATTLNDGTNAVLEITSTHEWTAQPQVGDTLKVETAFAGLTSGFYMVTASTAKTVSVSRLSAGTSGAPGTETGVPAGFVVERPVIDGLGKSMEVDGDVTSIFKTISGNPVGFSDSVIYSPAEQVMSTTVSRDTVEDIFEAGGDIVLQVGTTKPDARVIIDDEKLSFMEGAAVAFEATFEQYVTLKDLADFISSQPQYSASLASARYAVRSPSILDRGEYHISSMGSKVGRIKADAKAWLDEVNQSGLVRVELIGQSGLPEESLPEKFLSGGAKNGTSSLDVVQAFDAVAAVDTNFVVALFSKDASEDIASSLTDSSSTYTIDAINALKRNHVVSMSRLKAKKNRIAIASRSGSYTEQKEAAAEVGSFRLGFAIQDVKVTNSQGQVQQFQPWMSAVIAAGMQAAAGYKGIVKKFANVNGVVHADQSFNSKSQTQREDALKAGLLIMESVNTGGFRWVSDQTSYTVDNNFVFNSLQAVYIADLMSLTLINSFERAVVGKSVAEISAAAALGFLESELFNFKRLKWITASDDAPKGWKNASIRIQGGVMRVSVEVKLAGLVYFVPINLAISEVTQEASQ